MEKNLKSFFRESGRYVAASLLILFLILALVYLSIGIYPGSSRSILASDAFSRFPNFHANFRNALLGKQSIFYIWNASLRLNYLSLVSYYLGGIFTPLVFFFPNQVMPDTLYVLVLLKVGCAGLTLRFLACMFRIPRWGHVTLSASYALISFITAHSEIIMQLDAFVYLSLVILGIHRVMDLKRPKLLFISYLPLFLSSFYIGFMIDVFSFLYFIAYLLTNQSEYKKTIVPYGVTSLLAGGISMVIILSAVLDLQSNGEALSQITTSKTETTSYLDLIMKNMIGVYGTAGYESIPFVYADLLPLVLCLFYFASQKVPLKNRFLYGSLFAILIASSYLVPLNLFWHGMHTPNMFLFRYAYLSSSLVPLLAGKGWEKIEQDDRGLLLGIILVVAALFVVAWNIKPERSYTYVTMTSFVLTVIFLGIYAFTVGFYRHKKLSFNHLSILLLLIMSTEALANTNSMIHDILDDWNYVSRSLYTDSYPDLEALVNETKRDSDSFYRLENLDPVSANDSTSYGYSGISLFPSIGNHNSSSYLDKLGFCSRGTNLSVRYNSNTLLVDGFTGIKYNISKNEGTFSKCSFRQAGQGSDCTLYQNVSALPLAFTTPLSVNDVGQSVTDNLTNQTNLINTLSGLDGQYFAFYTPALKNQLNTTIIETTTGVTYSETTDNQPKELAWEVHVPASIQAYLSLFPANFAQLESSSAAITVDDTLRETQVNISSQYYDLGYYPQETTVAFTTSFYGTKEISSMEPKVVGLDVVAYQAAMNQIKEKGIEVEATGKKASGTVNTAGDSMLATTIPYDKGWEAKIDGKPIEVNNFKDAFLMVKVPAGKHTVTFSYLPEGFTTNAILFVLCTALFVLYVWYLDRNRPFYGTVDPAIEEQPRNTHRRGRRE